MANLVLSQKDLERMMGEELLTAQQIREIARWLARGDGIAVYRNNDSHSDLVGSRQFVGFGSRHSKIKDRTPPRQMPNFPGLPSNWQYQLEGFTRGKNTL